MVNQALCMTGFQARSPGQRQPGTPFLQVLAITDTTAFSAVPPSKHALPTPPKSLKVWNISPPDEHVDIARVVHNLPPAFYDSTQPLRRQIGHHSPL